MSCKKKCPQELKRNLKGQELKDMEYAWTCSSLPLERLLELLAKKIETSRDKSDSRDNYLNPNWQLDQADQTGYRRALNEIKKLIEE